MRRFATVGGSILGTIFLLAMAYKIFWPVAVVRAETPPVVPAVADVSTREARETPASRESDEVRQLRKQLEKAEQEARDARDKASKEREEKLKDERDLAKREAENLRNERIAEIARKARLEEQMVARARAAEARLAAKEAAEKTTKPRISPEAEGAIQRRIKLETDLFEHSLMAIALQVETAVERTYPNNPAAAIKAYQRAEDELDKLKTAADQNKDRRERWLRMRAEIAEKWKAR